MNVGQARGSDRPTSRSFAHLKPIVGYLKPYWRQVLGALLALIVASGTVLSLGVGLRWLVDVGFGSGDPDRLDQALAALLVIVCVLAVATFSRFYLVSWIGERVVADLRRGVYDHVIGLSPSFFEQTRTGEILSRLTTDTTLLQVVIGSSASVALRNLLLLFGGSIMLLVTSLKLTGLVFLLVPAVVAPMVLFGRQVRRLSRSTQDRVADVADHVEEAINAVSIVQAFNHEDLDRREFGERVETAFKTSIERIRARAYLTAFVTLVVFGSVGIVLWVGGRDVLAGAITAGELSQFVFFAVVVAGAVGSISEVYGDLQRAAGAAERLMELRATPPEIAAPENPVALPDPARGEIAFEGMTFHYPSRPEQAALHDLTFKIEAGETVALVGPSGAGKSTLFQLLLRFYDPGSGTVRIDGVDLKDADPGDVRARIAVVPQDAVIFTEDAWSNIRYGRPDATDAEVREAANAAAASEFLDALPDGFGTFLGAKGTRLSGGQRQRIAIARAILRDPAILLLDEATSALDAESERLVQNALSTLMQDRTTLVIAHRLATVLEAGRILVIDGGRIVAAGTHASLIAEGGLYARLAALQFDTARSDTEAAE